VQEAVVYKDETDEKKDEAEIVKEEVEEDIVVQEEENIKDEKTTIIEVDADLIENNVEIIKFATVVKETDNAELAADFSKVKRIRAAIIQKILDQK